MSERSSVTLSDVAAVAGVSLSTASRALNGGGRISAATRARIAEVARRLDFRPNALAQSFALGRSRTIGILAYNARGAFTEPVLVGAVAHLGGREQACLLYDTGFDPDAMAGSVRRLLARRVDGLLVLGDGFQSQLRSVTGDFTVPVVYAHGLTDRAADSCYVPDGEMAGRLAGEHLLSLGRRRIAHITAEHHDAAAAGRERGLLTTLAEAGLPAAGDTLRGDWSRASGAAACRRLIESGTPFDAVFCGNDQIALGVESVLLEAGRRVPDDVALVGVDNWETVISGQGTRHLTTVDTGLAGLGAAAAAQVADGRDDPGPHAHPCELVVGATTGGGRPGD
ncbi:MULTISPECIES: LacI family DNA-binding transcriptional regulator [unclassified Streptomyces]|uniref:LacI family DNA-binding transcriptional regulator n=1 Tax=unclassified Streptomyces TaxID=2593676 RepID=UPI002DDC4A42|nr:LacI family DNA-binding transcriptional regulator [Streptomyces sp. NBC_01237]WRZ75341.1 LacI family transcriptional regulator [Streptomyces sp. NBC_01237]